MQLVRYMNCRQVIANMLAVLTRPDINITNSSGSCYLDDLFTNNSFVWKSDVFNNMQ